MNADTVRMENKNGDVWYDMNGDVIQAHGGMILFHEGRWYWYGENKNGQTYKAASGDIRVDFTGISCYSSDDCVRWKHEGNVLVPSSDPLHDLYKDRVCERPKVLYNKKTKEFVMWMHIDTADYTAARAGVAVSDYPTGPFRYLGSVLPNRSDCRDIAVFQEKDGTAYLIHSSDWNKTLRISRLTDDYKSFTGVCTQAFIEQEREAPALFCHENTYYMITSGCTGWDANSALYAKSANLQSGWKLIDNPCIGKNARKTYFGQSTYVFEKEGKFYLMLDHWKPDDLKNSGYSILPIEIRDGEVTVSFTEYPFSASKLI